MAAKDVDRRTRFRGARRLRRVARDRLGVEWRWLLGRITGRVPRGGLSELRRWRRGGGAPAWVTIEAYDLAIELHRPGRFEAVATLTLSNVASPRICLLLNRNLTVRRSVDGDGRTLRTWSGVPSATDGWLEARAVWIELRGTPPGGRVELTLHYGGPAAGGESGSDWRGILICDERYARMSDQTVFYPTVPGFDGSAGPSRAPARLEVAAPAHFEVYAPLSLVAREPSGDGSIQRWTFQDGEALALSLLAGRYERSNASRANTDIITLLRPENRGHAAALSLQVGAALDFFAARFGPCGVRQLGVVEIDCRSNSSYNWSGDRVIALDRRSFGSGPPTEILSHEIAHLWWGVRVTGAGAGARFLSESLAEYSAWRFIAQHLGPAAELAAVGAARQRYRAAVEGGARAALCDLTPHTPWYQVLAYDKGPLVLRYLEGCVGTAVLDRALARLAEIGHGACVDLATFEQALDDALGGPLPALPWLRSAGDLQVELIDSWYSSAHGIQIFRFSLHASIELAADTTLQVELELRGPSGTRRQVLELRPTALDVTVPTDEALAVLAIDPAGRFPLPCAGPRSDREESTRVSAPGAEPSAEAVDRADSAATEATAHRSRESRNLP